MSKPVFENVFTFEGRRNRLSYFLFTLALVGMLVIATILASTATTLGASRSMSLLLGVLGIPFSALFVVMSLAAFFQRCHDIGWSGKPLLIIFIVLGAGSALLGPILGIVAGLASSGVSLALLLMPGTDGPNKYGPDPRKAPLQEGVSVPN
ncbi:DUF805 domain-containing protein [Pseudovibrio sp. SPO723]|uniref:DUF805 domain-containing protein n=1 Tax=Nesiotobacter zosterae TaxID=392721 RepID=UPI0029C367A2|nr:DUF805 domain-containing protein [Pseudovibrio sp. SPO723]MDX5593440.1 DUF805 domain-containing protein [Pseudovibrio sp. SPO723]